MIRNRPWALGAMVLGAVLLLNIGCDVTIDDDGDVDGEVGPTEARDDSFNVGASPVLVVTSENGSIEVETGSTGTIRVQATLRNAPRVRYEASKDGDIVTVEAEVESQARNAGVNILITAPVETEVGLKTSNGGIEVRELEASGNLRTSNGSVVLGDVKGDFNVLTSNGSIQAVSMEGVGTLRTSNGSVTLAGVKGAFEVDTSNANISFSGEMTPGGDNRLETSNGSVTVELKGVPGVNLDASTNSGEVTCRLPIEASRTGKERLVGTIGDGEAELRIRTSNGSVIGE